MTAVDIATVKPEVTRDRFGRPLIVPPDGGKPVAYSRATTIAETLDDRYNLEQWKMRQVALGLADRPDLALAVAAHRDDKQRLNKICQSAIEAAKSSAAATTGTALHALTDLIDLERELPVLPKDAQADLDAYRQATKDLVPIAVEQFLVLDDLQVAGTADRVVLCPDGVHRIADLKTGSTIDYSAGAIAIQLALYSRGVAYDPTTGKRTPLPDVDQDTAIVVHLPAGQATCTLHRIDIRHGWTAAQIAMRVRAYRRFARKGLLSPIERGT